MPKGTTLAEYLVSKVGLRKATTVATFVVAWGIYTERSEAPYTMARYTKFWRQSLAMSYKERDLFRICFPGDADEFPDRVWALCREVYRAKAEDRERERMAARTLSICRVWP